MTRNRRSTLVRLGLVVVLLLLAGMACNLSRGDKKDSDTAPTVPVSATSPGAELTPSVTAAGALPSATPYPTWTPRPPFVQPTSTPVAWVPTPYPTLPPVTAYPYDIRITSPVNGSTLSGIVTVMGSASHPSFLQYALEWAPADNPGLWFPLTSPPQTGIVINRVLGFWNTTTVSDSNYRLRLHVWLTDGAEVYYPNTSGLQVAIRNSNPIVPSPTPTTRPNQPPTINPIANQTVSVNQSANVPVVTSDPNNDTVDLYPVSSNRSIATVEAISRTQIRITGVSAGQATIRVTANDNFGGLANAYFVVTVTGQNRPPDISPIPAQAIKVRQVAPITVNAADPDGDPLTVSATAKNASVGQNGNPNQPVVTVEVPNPAANIVRLTGQQEGTATVTVTVSDNRGASVSTVFQVTVGPSNRPPTIQTISNQTMTLNQTVDVPFVATDPDNDTLIAVVTSENGGVVSAAVPANTSVVRLTANGVGSTLVSVSVNDGKGGLATTSFWVTVGQPNRNPTIAQIGDKDVIVDQTLDVTFAANDLDGDPLTAIASTSDQAIVSAFVPAFGTVRVYGASAGTATVTVTVNDGRGGTASTSFDVTVEQPNRNPFVEEIADQVITLNDTRDLSFAAGDPDNDNLTTTASSSDNTIVSVQVLNAQQLRLTGQKVGSATVTVNLSDGRGGSASTNFLVTVDPQPNNAPSINPIQNQTLTVGDTETVTFTASDPDQGDQLTALAVSQDGTIVLASVPTFGAVELKANAIGQTSVTVSVDDGRGGTDSTTFSVTVEAVPNNQPSIETIPDQTLDFNAVVDVPYTASDPDAGDTLTGSAQSNDPNVVAALVTAPGTVQLTAVNPGQTSVVVNVNDGKGGTASTTFAVMVNQPPNSDPVIDPIQDQTLAFGEQRDVAFNAYDPDPGNTVNVSVGSQDDTIVTAALIQPGQLRLTAVKAGQTTVTVSADDGQGGSASRQFTVVVEPAANQNPTIDPISDQSLDLNEVRNISYTASDPDQGDTLTGVAQVQDPSIVSALVVQAGTIQLTGQMVGATVVMLTVEDGRGGVATRQFTVTVQPPPNNNPVIEPVQNQTLAFGEQKDVTFTASDPDPGDSATVTAQSQNDGVVTAQVIQPGTVRLTAVGAGSTIVVLTAADQNGGSATQQFSVTVEPPPNNDPVINTMPGDQTLQAGETRDVSYAASDPDAGDQLTALAQPQDTNVVQATVIQPGTIRLTANPNTGGSTTVTLTVQDQNGGSTSAQFVVTVTAPNTNPSIDQVPAAQSLSLGESRTVSFAASDPDPGDSVTPAVEAQNPSVVAATIAGPGTIQLMANSTTPGTTTIMITVTDQNGGSASATFDVTVEAPPNSNPTIDSVPGDQVLALGEQLEVLFAASDPDPGDSVTASVQSQNPSVVSATVTGPNTIQLVASQSTSGVTSIILTVNDQNGGSAVTQFTVTVEEPLPNNPPQIQPIADQEINVGDQPTVIPVAVSDPEGDTVTLTALPGDPNIVSTEVQGNQNIVLQGLQPGSTQVTVIAADPNANETQIAFTVTVMSNGPQPGGFDLNDVDTFPTITPSMAQFLNQVYTSGVTNYSNQPGAFSKVGDDPVNSDNFLKPIADGEPVAGNLSSLQGMVAVYLSTPVRASDPSLNSFNVDSVATGAGYDADTILNDAPLQPPCTEPGSYLLCEYKATRPAIALISFSAESVIYYPDSSMFKQSLDSIVMQSLQQGVIPVLMTIPEEPGVSYDQLLPYNQIIVEVAEQSNIPLVNLWRAMNERGITDPNSVYPGTGGAANFTNEGLAYGYNVRNAAALYGLYYVREGVGIQ